VRPPRSWRTADFPLPVLLAGIVLVSAAALGLASLGSAFGVVAIAALLAGVVVLFWYWGREQLRTKPD
jgi:energy-converting hydrogenase Eha subunit A